MTKEELEKEAEKKANENGAKKYAEFYFETNEKLTKAKVLIKDALDKIDCVEHSRWWDKDCPLCKQGKIIKKPYTKGAGYFYQCNYCGLVK